MRRSYGHDGIYRHSHDTVGAVLEAHRAAQPGGQLAVALAFRGARADRAPGDKIADERSGENAASKKGARGPFSLSGSGRLCHGR